MTEQVTDMETVTLTRVEYRRRIRQAKRAGWREGAAFGHGYAVSSTVGRGPALPSFIADQNPYGKPRAGTTP